MQNKASLFFKRLTDYRRFSTTLSGVDEKPVQLKSPKIYVRGFLLSERTLEDAQYHSIWSKITPMGRPADSSDIAEAALFLVSDKVKHITGQSLIIDGGWTCISPSPF